MSKKYPTNVLTQAQATLQAWQEIDPALALGNLTQAVLTTDLEQAQAALNKIQSLEAQLTDARNQRDAAYATVWDEVKRVRSAIKGIYGDDSSQYEMVGGTRLSERKKPVRKTESE